MKIKISILGIIGAILGFISIAIPWAVTPIYNLSGSQTGAYNVTLYGSDNPPTFPSVIALLIIGSVFMILFLNKIDFSKISARKYIKNGLFVIGIIGVILNLMAVVTFSSTISTIIFMNASTIGLIIPFTITVSIGLIFGIISVILGIINIFIFVVPIRYTEKLFIPINKEFTFKKRQPVVAQTDETTETTEQSS